MEIRGECAGCRQSRRIVAQRTNAAREFTWSKIFSSRFALPLQPSTSAAADNISVVLDRAQVIRLPDRVATLIIGNPSVADGTLQNGGLLVVTGKGYGSTNVIALDSRGEVLAEHTVTVGAPSDGTLDGMAGCRS